MKKRSPLLPILGVMFLLLALGLGLLTQSGNNQSGWTPRVGFNDATPLGGKGLRLLLEKSGYRVRASDKPLSQMPADARIWLLVDPVSRFSTNEAKLLVKWMQNGGTLIWADTSPSERSGLSVEANRSSGLEHLRKALGGEDYARGQSFRPRAGLPLPPLVPLGIGAANVYRTGSENASASGATLTPTRAHLVVFGVKGSAQLSRIEIGKGRAFVMADALLWTNLALSKAPNSALVTNLIRVHAPPGSAVYWDERQHDTPEEQAQQLTKGVLYYLWQPPLRWALLQVLAALLLAWAFWGRRLGRAVSLPAQAPVTRASQWAVAMGALFAKAERPKVAASTVGEAFRAQLARRIGLSPGDSDAAIAARAATFVDVPHQTIDHLLLRARVPSDDAAQMLRDVQDMELLLQNLDHKS